MKWKFRASANVELKFCRKLLHENEKKNHSWSFSWDFFVENRYTVDQEYKKNHFYHLVWRPAPSPSHNTVSLNSEILMILWKCMTRFLIQYIFAFVLSPFAFQFILKLPKWPNFNYIKLTIENCNVLWIPLYLFSWTNGVIMLTNLLEPLLLSSKLLAVKNQSLWIPAAKL